MGVWCYTTEDGTTTVEEFTVPGHTPPSEITLPDGRIAIRDIAATHRKSPKHKPNTGWPMKSDAAGVGPDQAQEAMDHSVSIGIPTEFDRNTGQAVFTSRKHRRDYCRAIGLHDRNGGYGDP